MKTITINKQDYKFEFTIEASLYPECTETIMSSFVSAGMAQNLAEKEDGRSAVDELLKTMANIPQKTLTLFYSGLLENHNLSKEEAKELLKEYLKESGKSFTDVLQEMMSILDEDNFFDLIGLNKMFQPNEESRPGKNTSAKK